MSFSEPLPPGFQPVACMTCGALVVNDPVLRDFHADAHDRAALVPVHDQHAATSSPPAGP